MHLVQILLPRTDNDGKPFPRTLFDQLKKEPDGCASGRHPL